ncbi:MAG: hypothetical protein AAF958_10520 [Planctomycetota bacterium]
MSLNISFIASGAISFLTLAFLIGLVAMSRIHDTYGKRLLLIGLSLLLFNWIAGPVLRAVMFQWIGFAGFQSAFYLLQCVSTLIEAAGIATIVMAALRMGRARHLDDDTLTSGDRPIASDPQNPYQPPGLMPERNPAPDSR